MKRGRRDGGRCGVRLFRVKEDGLFLSSFFPLPSFPAVFCMVLLPAAACIAFFSNNSKEGIGAACCLVCLPGESVAPSFFSSASPLSPLFPPFSACFFPLSFSALCTILFDIAELINLFPVLPFPLPPPLSSFSFVLPVGSVAVLCVFIGI